MKLDGRRLQKKIIEQLRKDMLQYNMSLRVAIMSIGEHPQSLQYMKIKQKVGLELGIDVDVISLPSFVDTAEILKNIQDIQKKYHGFILQLPVPTGINVDVIVSSIPQSIDIDFLNPQSLKNIPRDYTVGPPVALAVKALLQEAGIDMRNLGNLKFAIVGEGFLVGRPCAEMLQCYTPHVYILHEKTPYKERKKILSEADTVVSGAGVAGLIKPEDIKFGVILVDAGTSSPHSLFAGDIDHGCYTKAAYYTPVPGGVGPVAVAMLFRNLIIKNSLHK